MIHYKGEESRTEQLLKNLNKNGSIHLIPATVKGKYIIRYVVTTTHTTESDIERDWNLIKSIAYELLD